MFIAGYVDEDESATQSHVRQIWSVNSKFGGSYVSIPTGDKLFFNNIFF
jgi:hypothetical protein